MEDKNLNVDQFDIFTCCFDIVACICDIAASLLTVWLFIKIDKNQNKEE